MTQPWGFIVFRVLIPLVFLTLQYLLYRKTMGWLRREFPDGKILHRAVMAAFSVFTTLLVLLAIFRPTLSRMPEWAALGLSYPLSIWFGSILLILIVLGVVWILKLPLTLYSVVSRFIDKIRGTGARKEPRQESESRRVFIRTAVTGLAGVSFGSSAYGVFIGKSRCEVTGAEFVFPHLPPQMDGFRIGLMSDIHSSVFMTRQQMRRYVDEMNELKTDMILVTGDFVNSHVEEVYPFAEAFSELDAPYGVFGVLGNHDFFTREVDVVAQRIDDCGVKLLRNDNVRIERNGASFHLLGIDDVGRAQRATEFMQKSIAGIHDNAPKILMCHRPYFLEQAAEQKIDLVLSGHTHGGQVSLGRLGETVLAPASFASKFVWGTYSKGNTSMYINRGIGTVGLPLRLNCPPELTVITLKTSPSA